MARLTSILFLAAVLPFALAHNTQDDNNYSNSYGNNNNNNDNGYSGSNNSGKGCSLTEFFFEAKSCCLPKGGPQNPPSPPKGVSCPVSGWSWHEQKQCCVPHDQPKPSNPPPQCPKDCFWSSLDLKCYPGSTPSKPTPTPQPSSKPGYHYRKRAEMKSRAAPLCPNAMEACPIKGAMGTTGDLECLDTTTELESCGGCASTGAGQDCSAIEGAWNVACNQGSCVVYTCQQGYKLGSDHKSCIKL